MGFLAVKSDRIGRVACMPGKTMSGKLRDAGFHQTDGKLDFLGVEIYPGARIRIKLQYFQVGQPQDQFPPEFEGPCGEWLEPGQG